MNHHQSKMNLAVKKKARSFATMGAGFVDEMETKKMEERLQLMKMTMEMEREERKNRGGQFWKSGQKGKLTTYANTVLQSKLSNKKIGKVKMLTEEPLNIPNRNDAASLSKRLGNISNNSSGIIKPATKENVRLCGQCESNGAALCCIQCTEVYCTACFSAYHKKGALRKHRSISLEVSSTPRSKPPSYDKRIFDSALYSAAPGTASQLSDSPSGASDMFKADEEDVGMSSLMDGNYDEAGGAASFQEAVLAWRTGSQPSATAGAAAAASSIGTVSSVSNTRGILSSQPKSQKNEGIDSSTSTTDMKVTLASLMDKKQNHTLTYAEQLLVKRNRRTPISWETEPSEKKDNLGQMKMEETSSVLNSDEIPERLSNDEPVTFSALYSLVAQESRESDMSSPREEDKLTDTNENVQDVLLQKPEVPKMATEDIAQPSISVVPLVESFPGNRPSSSASQPDEKITIKNTSSHQSGKNISRSQVQSATKYRPKSKRSAGVSHTTNLTTTPSEGLQMVGQMAKSEHRLNNGQQPSLLMIGLSNDESGDANEINPSETDSLFKSNSGVTRPDTAVKVSYTLYKMSPRSWHPEESISLSVSDKSKSSDDTSSNPTSVGVQRGSTFVSLPNTGGTISPVPDMSTMMENAKGDNQASENPTANSSSNQDLERSSTISGDSGDPPHQTIRELDQIFSYFNNNASSQYEEKCKTVSPNNETKETAPSIPIDSTRPVYPGRSKTMLPISKIPVINKDHHGTPVNSARRTPRNRSAPPDRIMEKQNDGFGQSVHSIKHFSRNKTISPIPTGICSEERVSPVIALKDSTTSLYSVKDRQSYNIEFPIPADALENPSDTPVLSARNTPRSNTMPLTPTITEQQLHSSISSTRSINSTPRRKTKSAIHILQDTQKKRSDSPVHSVIGTPRYESMSPIPPVRKTFDKQSLTEVDTEESIYSTFASSSKSRSKTASPISNIPENIGETSANSSRCKTASTISTMIEFQENASATPVYSAKGTPRSTTESPIPTIIDSQGSTPNTPANDAPRSTTESPISTIINSQGSTPDTPANDASMSPIQTKEKQLNYSISPAPSTTRGTPRTKRSNVNTTTCRTKSSAKSHHEEENEEETFQFNTNVYQMLVNENLPFDTPDPPVPMLPTATEPNRTTIDLNEPSETTSSTDTDLTSSDCMPISTSPACSSKSYTLVDSEEKLLNHDRFTTPFYMCNSELYDADSALQGSDSMAANLKRRSTPTKKYIIRRAPEIPDGTKPQKSNFPRGDDLQLKSTSPTLSVVELKRINFKQSNYGQNVTLEEKTNNEQSNLDLRRSSLSPSANIDGSAEDDPDSVFSSLTKMSVDSLDVGPSQSPMFDKDEFLMSDDLQAEIDEMEEQIAEEIKQIAIKYE